MADLNKADEERLKAVERTVTIVKFVGIVAGIFAAGLIALVIAIGAGLMSLSSTLGELREAKAHHTEALARLDADIRRLNDRLDKFRPYGSHILTVQGNLVSVTGDKLVLRTGTGKERTFLLAPDVRVRLNGKAAELADLKAGAPILVSIPAGEGERVIEIDSPPPPPDIHPPPPPKEP